MKLVLGGYAQGKLEYVLSEYKLQEPVALDGAWPAPGSLQGKQLVVNHFHQWVKSRISEGGCPEEEISGLLDAYRDCIIICDEVGNGIVPAGSAEREYRERVGRILILLAQRAEEVERVICGIGQKIK